MKISRKNSRKRSRHLKKIGKRLAAYSAAAAATVVTTQDRSANAEDRVWDIADITTNANTRGISFNMVTGGTIEATYDQQWYFYAQGNFRLFAEYNGYLYGPAYTTASPRTVLGFVGTGTSYITPLAGGVSVDAADNFVVGGPWYRNYYGYLNWSDGQTAFAGIRFQLGTDTHYGWAQITRADSENFILHGFGYNDEAGVASVTPTVNTVETLTLEVNTITGEMTLLGDEQSDVYINNYQITSAGDSLDDENWISLEDQDFDGNGPPDPLNPGDGWEESGGVGPDALEEAYLLGDSSIDANAAVSLGMGYNVDVNAQDLEFRFRTTNGSIFNGLVDYVTTAVFEADFDQDGDVDGDDFLLWQTGFGTPSGATKMDGDYDNDGDVDGDDFLGWQDEFGSAGEGAGSAAVPEPSSILLLAAGAAGFGLWRRRRTG